MSHIANAIDALLKEHNKSAAELARTSGINEAQISRFRSAAQVWVAPDDLKRIASGFCQVTDSALFEEIHAKLLKAHLQDSLKGPGAKYISLNLTFAATDSQPTSDSSPLPPSVQKEIDQISRYISDKKIRGLVHAVAAACPI